MAIIDRKARLLYFLAPGTGSSALEKYFLNSLKSKRLPEYREENGRSVLEHPNSKLNIDPKHCTYNDLVSNNLLTEEEQTYLRVCSVRNPYDYWYAEWYRRRTRFVHLLKQPGSWIYNSRYSVNITVDSCTLSFAEWIKKIMTPKLNDNWKGFLHDEYVNHSHEFIRMENMTEDLHRILKLQNYQSEVSYHVKKYNVTQRTREYWREYDSESRDLIANLYSPHLERFNYNF